LKIPTILLLLLAVSPVGCGGYYSPIRPGESPLVKSAVRVDHYASESRWMHSGYWRTEDQPDYPWLVIIAGDGTACPVFDHRSIDEPTRGEFYACPVAWRMYRAP